MLLSEQLLPLDLVMDNSNIQKTDKSSGISIKDVLKVVKAYLWELFKFSWLLAIFSLLIGYYLYRSKAKIPTTYTASLSFSYNEASGADQGFMQQVLGGGFLGLSGLDSELEGSSGKTLLQELIKTRKTIELTFFQKISLPDKNGKEKEDYFIHHYLEIFGYREAWKKAKSHLADIYFTSNDTETFSRDQNILLQTAYSSILSQNLTDELSKAGILTMHFSSSSEVFCYTFLRKFFDVLNTYYTQKSIEKQRRIFEAAKSRRDSLESEMDKAEKGYISYLNTHNLSAMGQHAEKIEIQYLGRKLTGEMEAYFLAIKNVETAKIALEQQTPMLQPIDKPIYPLRSEKPNAFRALIMGLIIGFLLGFVIVVGQKAIRDFIKYSKENKLKIDDTTLTNTEPTEIPNFPTP